jgi:hypothetical protein
MRVASGSRGAELMEKITGGWPSSSGAPPTWWASLVPAVSGGVVRVRRRNLKFLVLSIVIAGTHEILDAEKIFGALCCV